MNFTHHWTDLFTKDIKDIMLPNILSWVIQIYDKILNFSHAPTTRCLQWKYGVCTDIQTDRIHITSLNRIMNNSTISTAVVRLLSYQKTNQPSPLAHIFFCFPCQGYWVNEGRGHGLDLAAERLTTIHTGGGNKNILIQILLSMQMFHQNIKI